MVSSIISEKGQKLDINLVDRLSSISQDEDEDFRVDENGVLKL